MLRNQSLSSHYCLDSIEVTKTPCPGLSVTHIGERLVPILTWMVHSVISMFTRCVYIYYVNEDGRQLWYTVFRMSDHYTFSSFFRPSVDMDLGLSRGRPRARLHTREEHTPGRDIQMNQDQTTIAMNEL